MQIQGPAGTLEAKLERAVNEKTITAILSHPHPQYGGSMHDAVLRTAAEVLLEYGVNCLFFNFRGVGGSEGSFAHGTGEVDDLLAVIRWQQEEYPRDKLWLCGYSFGAHVTWHALAEALPQRAVLIAPPVGMMEFAALPEECVQAISSLDVIAGEQDNFVQQDQLSRWEAVNAHVIPGADHFFSNSHAQLKETLADIVRQ
ncbi:MAG: alpha/beta fold hydrolase [Pseudomonadota bacterium]